MTLDLIFNMSFKIIFYSVTFVLSISRIKNVGFYLKIITRLSIDLESHDQGQVTGKFDLSRS